MRHAAGYWRYDTQKELDVLNELWAKQSLMTNLFLPQQKLTGKTRIGARVIKTYDQPRTPARRLLDDHPDLVDDHDRRHIEHQLGTLNPAQIRRDIGRLQDQLKMYAVRRGPVEPATRRHAAYTSRTKINPPAKRTPGPIPSGSSPAPPSPTAPRRQGRSSSPQAAPGAPPGPLPRGRRTAASIEEQPHHTGIPT